MVTYGSFIVLSAYVYLIEKWRKLEYLLFLIFPAMLSWGIAGALWIKPVTLECVIPSPQFPMEAKPWISVFILILLFFGVLISLLMSVSVLTSKLVSLLTKAKQSFTSWNPLLQNSHAH